jgi:hypothetical protein
VFKPNRTIFNSYSLNEGVVVREIIERKDNLCKSRNQFRVNLSMLQLFVKLGYEGVVFDFVFNAGLNAFKMIFNSLHKR